MIFLKVIVLNLKMSADPAPPLKQALKGEPVLRFGSLDAAAESQLFSQKQFNTLICKTTAVEMQIESLVTIDNGDINSLSLQPTDWTRVLALQGWKFFTEETILKP